VETRGGGRGGVIIMISTQQEALLSTLLEIHFALDKSIWWGGIYKSSALRSSRRTFLSLCLPEIKERWLQIYKYIVVHKLNFRVLD
jgi:hypothetical protein